MTAESVEALLRHLTSAGGETAAQVYANWASLTITPAATDGSLEQLVRRKLVAGGKSSQLRESLLATIQAGGAQGETVEACLRNTGLTGWS